MQLIEKQKMEIKSSLNAEQKITTKFAGQIFLPKGMLLYSYDPSANEMKKVTLSNPHLKIADNRVEKNQLRIIGKTDNLVYKAYYDSSKLYCMAINEKNAAKKFAKQLIQLTEK